MAPLRENRAQADRPGLRRILIDERGHIKSELKRGEHKSFQTDRVILMPGPEEEVAWVTKMYRWLIENDLNFREIADGLNEAGIATDLDRPWTSSSVRTVLTNEKYIGNNVFNRSSFKLKKLHVENPPDMWIRKEGAFEGNPQHHPGENRVRSNGIAQQRP